MLSHLGLGNQSPIYILSTALEVVAISYLAFHTLRSLNESRKFREKNGAKPNYKLRNLIIQIFVMSILHLLRLAIVVSSLVIVVVSFRKKSNVHDCLDRSNIEVQEKLGADIQSLTESCFYEISKYGNVYFTLYSITFSLNVMELFIPLSQKLSEKVGA